MFCVANTTTITNPHGSARISLYSTLKNTANRTLECYTQTQKTPKHTFRNPRVGQFHMKPPFIKWTTRLVCPNSACPSRIPDPVPNSGCDIRVRHRQVIRVMNTFEHSNTGGINKYTQTISPAATWIEFFLLVKPLISHFVCWEKDLLGELGTWPQKERPQTFAESTADLYHCLRMLEECVAFSWFERCETSLYIGWMFDHLPFVAFARGP